MRTALTLLCASLFAAAVSAADEVASPVAEAKIAATAIDANSKPPKSTEAKALSGMSILGNQEAPKALVIVPWKSSQLGEPQGISKQLDDGRQPVDKDVFMRELSYYEIRTGAK